MICRMVCFKLNLNFNYINQLLTQLIGGERVRHITQSGHIRSYQ